MGAREKEHCPVGDQCVGCEYAECCAHPALQAERLRGEVARVTRERDEALDCGATGGEEACGCCIACMRADLKPLRDDNARLALRIAHGDAAHTALSTARAEAMEEVRTAIGSALQNVSELSPQSTDRGEAFDKGFNACRAMAVGVLYAAHAEACNAESAIRAAKEGKA